MIPAPQPPQPKPELPVQRRYDLDWLRVLAVLVLVHFHTAVVFYQGELGEFYIQNSHSSSVMSGVVLFVHQWHMPLFFWISGAATRFALSYRSVRQYLWERVQRLLIPFGFGTLVLVPPQVYLRLVSQGRFTGSYWQFYPQFFQGIRPQGNFEWAHLWFLIYLFTFSLASLPLLLYLRRLQFSATLGARLARCLVKPGGLLLLALPLAVIEASLRPHWPGLQNLYDDWANVCLFGLYFLYGYWLSAEPQLEAAIDQQTGSAWILAVISMGLSLVLWYLDLVPPRDYSLGYLLYQGLRGCNSCFWVLGLLGLGRQFLNVPSRLLAYANEAAYPVYLLHQTVLVIVAFSVVRWNLNVGSKFLIICTATLVVTLLAYELLIRPWNLLRPLFGLKPLPQQPKQHTPSTR